MSDRKPTGYWTLEACKSDALRYTTRTAWRRESGSAVAAATKNGWLDECCAHMVSLQKPKGYWTFEACLKNASRYSSRTAWMNESGSAYSKALAMGWVERCSAHMERLGNNFYRQLYVYEHPDKSVYVGLSYNPKKRHLQHMRKNKTLIEKQVAGGQVFRIFSEFLPKDVAAIREGELIEEYRRSGWTILNMVKAGGLGGATLMWTLEACKEDALKYYSKNEWAKKSSGAWNAVLRHGWIAECCGHMEPKKHLNGHWNLESCQADALTFQTKGEWKELSASAYGIAWSNGWLEQCCAHMAEVRAPKGSRTLQDCRADALKYASKTEWQEDSSGVYKVAYRNGWVDQWCSHMVESRKPEGFWNDKIRCLEEGRKYAKRSEWQKASHSSYKAAVRNGWLDECCSHMVKHRKPEGYWNDKNRCMEEGRRFSKKSDWRKESFSSFKAAVRNGWLDECCAHMGEAESRR